MPISVPIITFIKIFSLVPLVVAAIKEITKDAEKANNISSKILITPYLTYSYSTALLKSLRILSAMSL